MSSASAFQLRTFHLESCNSRLDLDEGDRDAFLNSTNTMTNEINLWFLSRIQTFAKELVETILEADALIVNAKPTTLAISSARCSTTPSLTN